MPGPCGKSLFHGMVEVIAHALDALTSRNDGLRRPELSSAQLSAKQHLDGGVMLPLHGICDEVSRVTRILLSRFTGYPTAECRVTKYPGASSVSAQS